MDSQQQIYDHFERFQDLLAGAASEDLATVLTHVRLQTKPVTQAHWARERTTRQFCDLGLHLLHQRHFHGDRSVRAHSQGALFPSLRPEDVVNHASRVIRDQAEADALTKQRWADTWGHQGNYIEDLIAYLFRPGPFVARIRDSQLSLTKMVTGGLRLGELIREGVKVEIESNLKDPLGALQTFVQTALPTRPRIQEHARRLDEETIRHWALLYEALLPAYGLQLREGRQWSDMAKTFTAVADGVLMRARIHDNNDLDRISTGDDVLSTVILGVIPVMLNIEAHEIESRELQQQIEPDLG